MTAEQKARDLLKTLSVRTWYLMPERMSAGDLVELANLFDEIERLTLSEIASETALEANRATIERLTADLVTAQEDRETLGRENVRLRAMLNRWIGIAKLMLAEQGKDNPDPPCDRCGDVCCGCYADEAEAHDAAQGSDDA